MKPIYLRGEEPPRQNHRFWKIIFILTITVAFFYSLSEGQMCGDCNNDSRVTVAELVKAVNNSLKISCTFGCHNTDLCPDECNEFPAAIINGKTIQCQTSLCEYTTQQVQACVEQFSITNPQQCREVRS